MKTMERETVEIPTKAARDLARVIAALLDKLGAYEGLLGDMGVDTGDDTDRLLIAGQRVVHNLRILGRE